MRQFVPKHVVTVGLGDSLSVFAPVRKGFSVLVCLSILMICSFSKMFVIFSFANNLDGMFWMCSNISVFLRLNVNTNGKTFFSFYWLWFPFAHWYQVISPNLLRWWLCHAGRLFASLCPLDRLVFVRDWMSLILWYKFDSPGWRECWVWCISGSGVWKESTKLAGL